MGERNELCPCKRKSCEWHGKCEECREHHKMDTRYPPYCDKIKEKAKNRVANNRVEGKKAEERMPKGTKSKVKKTEE